MPETVTPGVAFTRHKASHVHPRLVRTLLGNDFFPMTVTIQTRDEDAGNRTPTGDFIRPGSWTDFAGHVDIPARRGVPQSSERQANERTTDWGRTDADQYVIVLSGYFPTIRPEMRVVTDDLQYIDIRGVLSDSDKEVTTLTGRVLAPGSEGFE